MSGHADDAVVHHGMWDGAVAFLGKPFTPGGLLKKVRETLDGADLSAERGKPVKLAEVK
jgi:FixJ family two-component response regulator